MPSFPTRKFKVTYLYGSTVTTQVVVGVTHYMASKGEVFFYDNNRVSDYFSNVISVLEQI